LSAYSLPRLSRAINTFSTVVLVFSARATAVSSVGHALHRQLARRSSEGEKKKSASRARCTLDSQNDERRSTSPGVDIHLGFEPLDRYVRTQSVRRYARLERRLGPTLRRQRQQRRRGRQRAFAARTAGTAVPADVVVLILPGRGILVASPRIRRVRWRRARRLSQRGLPVLSRHGEDPALGLHLLQHTRDRRGQHVNLVSNDDPPFFVLVSPSCEGLFIPRVSQFSLWSQFSPAIHCLLRAQDVSDSSSRFSPHLFAHRCPFNFFVQRNGVNCEIKRLRFRIYQFCDEIKLK